MIATARTQGALEELDDEIRQAGSSATLVPLDLTDAAGIQRLATALTERWGHLDLLLHAAAQNAPFTPVISIDPDEFRSLLAVNVEAARILIAALDGLLRAAPQARAVFVDDPEGAGAFHGAYAASKAAMARLVDAYAAETRSSGPYVLRVLPPPMATALRRRGRPGEDRTALASPHDIAGRLVTAAGSARASGIIDLRNDLPLPGNAERIATPPEPKRDSPPQRDFDA